MADRLPADSRGRGPGHQGLDREDLPRIRAGHAAPEFFGIRSPFKLSKLSLPSLSLLKRAIYYCYDFVIVPLLLSALPERFF